MKPTGFEEYFADAPVTPAAFKEEQSLYSRYVMCLCLTLEHD